MNPTDKYKYCNHHHEIGSGHELVVLGGVEFVANKEAIPLLEALNGCGLKTRTHHYEGGAMGFVSIILDDSVSIEVRTVNERNADRTEYNGKTELLIQWDTSGDTRSRA